MNLNKLIFKYLVYYPVTFIRGEWIFFHFRNLKSSQYLDEAELEKYQLKSLNNLLGHARRSTSFYQNYPNLVIKDLSELQMLPLLSKEHLRDSSSDLTARERRMLSRSKTSGGSTGAAVTVLKDNHGMARELAAAWRGCEWAGVDIGDKQARFWGVPHTRKGQLISRLIDFIANRKRFSAFAFSDQELEQYIKELERFKPIYFYGYVSMIRQLAEFINNNDIPHCIRPRAIITTSEVLTEQDRILLESVFHTRVFNEYGCGELGTIAHQCELGNMHLNSENLVLELLDENGAQVPIGKSGEVVVTDLTNYSMPLIRYKLSDYATQSNEKCKCGRGLPIISSIHGRAYDFLISLDKKKYHGEFFLYIIEDLKVKGIGIKGIQFVQRAPGQLEVLIASGSQEVFELAKNFVAKKVNELSSNGFAVSFSPVDEIKREPSGKLRVVKKIG